jgi:putative endonuclease
MEKIPCVYILASERNGTIYVGVTSNLAKRIYEHKNNLMEGFTKKYKVHYLVYCEFFEDMLTAIAREKQIKGGSRKKKIFLIEKENPKWEDLSEKIIG